MELKNKKLRRFARRSINAVAGVAVACSVAVASLFAAPDELLDNDASAVDAPIVASDDEKRGFAVSGKSTIPGAAERLRVRVRGVFLRMPSVVRGLVLLPLWCVGRTILSIGSLLVSALSPVWRFLLGLGFSALLLIALFLVVYKVFFPNKSLKELFTRRNLAFLLGGAAALAVTDAILRSVWDEYAPISIAIKVVLAAAVLACLCWRLFGKRKPRLTA